MEKGDFDLNKVLCFLDSLKEFLEGFISVKSSVIVWVMLDTGVLRKLRPSKTKT